MKYEEIIERIDSLYRERESAGEDDLELINAYDYEVISLILRYAFDNNIELPGFNMRNFIRSQDCKPEDEDYYEMVDYDWHEDYDTLYFNYIENGKLDEKIQSLFNYYEEKWYGDS